MSSTKWSVGAVAAVVLCCITLINASASKRARPDPAALCSQHKTKDAKPNYPWVTAFFDAQIDNFAFTSNATYKMKYLYNTTFYKPGGPIFFYTGNEGSIEGFAINAGIMFDLAMKFNAALLYGEHRYYGVSMPFGNESYTAVERLGYLTTGQALADYARLLPYVKANVFKCSADTPVIAFGGSYGGMLSAWFRMKYPHLVTGAWASSAPLMYFKGGNVDPGAFYKVITDVFVKAGCNKNAIAKGWNAIARVAETPEGLTFLNNLFHIEQKSKLIKQEDAYDLVSFVKEAFDYMAMVNYPYPNSLLQPLPGWPIDKVCRIAGSVEPTNDRDLVLYMYHVANFYYNNTGTHKNFCVKYSVCGDAAISSLGAANGWGWQECTELIIEMCSRDGTNDFYFDDCKKYGGPLNMGLEYCIGEFTKIGWNPSFLWETAIPNEYGLEFSAASNLILTNGGVDPWSAGGVYETTPGIREASKNGVYTYYIEGSAHHLDLRTPNSCDPPPLTNLRYQAVKIMECWLHPETCTEMPKKSPLPPLGNIDKPEQCNYVHNGFPWGQETLTTTAQPTTPQTTTPQPTTPQPTTPQPTTTTSAGATVTGTMLTFMLSALLIFDQN